MRRRRVVIVGCATATILVAAAVAVALTSDDRAAPARLAVGSPTTSTAPVSSATSTTTTDGADATSPASPASSTSTSTGETATSTVVATTSTTTVPRRIAGKLPFATLMDVGAAPSSYWAVGSEKGVGVVARSTDDGASWTWVCVDRPITAVSALDDRRAFVAAGDGSLLFTRDGGATVSVVSTGLTLGGVSSIAFVDERTGWLAGSSAVPGAIGDGVLAATTDGGATWRTSIHPGVVISDVWTDGVTAFAAGSRYGAPPVVFALQSDGTWSTVEVPGLESLRAVTLAPHGLLVAVGGSLADAEGTLHGPSMAVSSDAGVTWSLLPESPTGYFWDVTATAAGTVVAAGGGGAQSLIVTSSDGGRTWTTAHAASLPGGAYTEVSAIGGRSIGSGNQPGAVITTAADSAAVWREVPKSNLDRC